MNEHSIFNLKKPCENRSVELIDNKDGTVSINGKLCRTSCEAEDYLMSIDRTDIPKPISEITLDKQILATLAQIATTIDHDGATEAFIKSDTETQINFINAYLDDILKKQKQFQNKYLTNEDFKREFQQLVLDMIKE